MQIILLANKGNLYYKKNKEVLGYQGLLLGIVQDAETLPEE